MKKRKKTSGKRSFGFLLILVIGLSAAYYAFRETKQQQQRKKALLVSYDPDFNPLPAGFARDHRDSIEAFFNDRLQLKSFHGMFLVAKNGEIIYERYQGLANEKTNLRFNAETPVHVASISKTITAIAVLRLVDANKIQLDKDIRHYLPQIPYKGITVRMLLNHRSGIPYYGYFPQEISPPDKPLTNKRILRILKHYHPKLYFPSNTQFAYCNTNYALLALIVEKVTKKRFPKAMQEWVFGPLNMKHSFIYEPARDKEPMALSYNSRGVLQEVTQLDLVYGDKNVYTTARDLLRLDKATYSNNFLSKRMKAEMFKGYSYERPGKANYGLGIRIREEKGKTPFFFHTGWWHGNTGCYASMRSDTVCMIVLSNHYTRRVFGINRLSLAFGNYPFAPLDPMEKTDKEGESP
ncbi:MAG TPA: serine hydrolase domain-containing protein [Fluviicola sp.]|nr:serine hydrolase domain-containing protein [Fluviicola sp.]